MDMDMDGDGGRRSALTKRRFVAAGLVRRGGGTPSLVGCSSLLVDVATARTASMGCGMQKRAGWRYELFRAP